eukprot:366541-Chlamydomonas_euryale.AAC.3
MQACRQTGRSAGSQACMQAGRHTYRSPGKGAKRWRLHARAMHLCSHARDELLTVERLLDVVHAARLKAALDVVDAAVGGDHDDWDGDAGVALVDLA